MISRLRTGFYSLALQLAVVGCVSTGLVGCVGSNSETENEAAIGSVENEPGAWGSAESEGGSDAEPSSFVDHPTGDVGEDDADSADGSDGGGVKQAPGAAAEVHYDPQPCPWEPTKHKTSGDS